MMPDAMKVNLIAIVVAVTLLASSNPAQPDDQKLPTKVDLSEEFDKLALPARAQGTRDVCSLFAVTGLANFEYARHEPQDHTQLSEEFLIWAAKKATGKSGDQAMFYEALCGLNHFGICSDRLMPYVHAADQQHQPSAQAVAEARRLCERWKVVWIKRWGLKNPLTDHQLHEMKQALAAHHPVACGMRWPKADKNGHSLLKVLRPRQVEDGHSILVTGYIDDPEFAGGGKFLFRNSWGTEWGDHGYGEMSFGYMRAYANDALWMQLGSEKSEVPKQRFEAESLPVLAHEHCSAAPQTMKDYHAAMWSGGKQLFCPADKGGLVELGFHVGQAGKYGVRVLATAAPDFGIVRIGFPKLERAHEFDLYSGRVSPSGSLELGVFDLNAGNYNLRFTAVGKNQSSDGYKFGIDAIDLISAP
jgi:hypothetical protein